MKRTTALLTCNKHMILYMLVLYTSIYYLHVDGTCKELFTYLGPMFSAVPGEIGPLLAGGGGEGGPLLAGGGGEGGPLLAGGGVQERENRGEVGLAVVQVWSLCLVRWTCGYGNTSDPTAEVKVRTCTLYTS